MAKHRKKLIYIGSGKFLYGVPAKDLDVVEVKKYGMERLLSSGLYVENKPADKKRIIKKETVEGVSQDKEKKTKTGLEPSTKIDNKEA